MHHPETHRPGAMHYNPYYHQNPLSRGQKIALGVVAGVAAVGTVAAIILIPGRARAANGAIVTTDEGKKKRGLPSKPPGSPPPYGDECFPEHLGGGGMYDMDFWNAGGSAIARDRIFTMFENLGYTTPRQQGLERTTMNDPGPDQALGGGDDVPNNEVKRFQGDYNRVSVAGSFQPNMGGLWEDGLVGPCTLNGLKFVSDNIGQGNWQQIAGAATA